jgi:predicted deacetylase
MKSGPAQYLLRFDDLCPTMSRPRFQRFLPIMEEFGIQPILAVVPDNQDPDLEVAQPDAEFWAEMRRMEAAGATIGLHGFRHLSCGRGRSLLPLHRVSEFAGVPKETQRLWIRCGLGILRDHGLNPKIWVAPRHGFDRNTLAALGEEGITLLSDGFARFPFTRGALTWIPQQLWAPMEKSAGIWTICIHSNTATDFEMRQVEDFVRAHNAQFTSVDCLLNEAPASRLSVLERLYGMSTLLRIQVSRSIKRLFREK